MAHPRRPRAGGVRSPQAEAENSESEDKITAKAETITFDAAADALALESPIVFFQHDIRLCKAAVNSREPFHAGGCGRLSEEASHANR